MKKKQKSTNNAHGNCLSISISKAAVRKPLERVATTPKKYHIVPSDYDRSLEIESLLDFCQA